MFIKVQCQVLITMNLKHFNNFLETRLFYVKTRYEMLSNVKLFTWNIWKKIVSMIKVDKWIQNSFLKWLIY